MYALGIVLYEMCFVSHFPSDRERAELMQDLRKKEVRMRPEVERDEHKVIQNFIFLSFFNYLLY